jgi:hypothetical protein
MGGSGVLGLRPVQLEDSESASWLLPNRGRQLGHVLLGIASGVVPRHWSPGRSRQHPSCRHLHCCPHRKQMMATTAEIYRPWEASAMAGCLKPCLEQDSRLQTRRTSNRMESSCAGGHQAPRTSICAIGSFQGLAVRRLAPFSMSGVLVMRFKRFSSSKRPLQARDWSSRRSARCPSLANLSTTDH